MKNKIQILLFMVFVPLLGACQSNSTIKYLVVKIDSTSLSEYYLITTIKSTDSLKIVSNKVNNPNKVGQKITIGQKILLSLNEISTLNVNGCNIRIGKGYFIDGKPIIYEGEIIYTTEEIKGLYYQNK